MALVTLKQLLEAGVHFGHQTSRWNPKMKRYIFTARNGIHIIDLQQTVKLLDEACNWVKDVVGGGRVVLFVGTKKQAQESIELEARRSGMPYVNHRWMGGMLTNFTVIRKQIDRLNALRAIRNNGGFTGSKKQVTKLEDELTRLERFFGGMADMKKLPGAVYVVDPRKEHIAVTEARKLHPWERRRHPRRQADHEQSGRRVPGGPPADQPRGAGGCPRARSAGGDLPARGRRGRRGEGLRRDARDRRSRVLRGRVPGR